MYCPVCEQRPLRPMKLEPGLVAHGCAACGGALVSVLAARDWAEGHPAPVEPSRAEATAPETSDTGSAITCPKCRHFMAKYRIEAGVGNRLDVCGHCGEFWADGGEWRLLASLDLIAKLPEVFSAPWQVGIRHREVAAAQEARIAAVLGEEDHARLLALKGWLADHPHAALILRELGAAAGGGQAH